MNRALHKRASALLAAVATLGLVVAPVIHAEVHLREQAQAHQQAVELVFRIAFERGELPDQDALLALAAQEAFGSAAPARVATAVFAAPAPLRLSPRYSTPEHSQAPPAA